MVNGGQRRSTPVVMHVASIQAWTSHAFKNVLLCRDNFHVDHYDEVFSNVTPTGKPTSEIQNVLAWRVSNPSYCSGADELTYESG
ncbi:hypothetical protein E4U19_006955 [Claviceps sp. Clav32 group G5]|nr:hypothetical protein E4U19_006955 [Claviceps sp. Clav32 group G5]